MSSVFEYAVVSLNDGLYDNDIATKLAETFDCCVNDGKLNGQQVARAFVASGLAEQFERQNPVYVAGKSGFELASLLAAYMRVPFPEQPSPRYDRSPDYWVGWSVAWFQLKTGRPYRSAFDSFLYDDLRGMYYPLHEADESKFIETLLRKLDALGTNRPTRLRARREAFGLSQSELARRANVGLRAIQMYEQRNKDINHAQGATLYRLSRALGCGMEDLLER